MYLVTGASGFVGRHLLNVLAPYAAERGGRVWVVCRSAAAWRAQAWTHAYANVQVLEGDVTQVEGFANDVVPGELRGIFHLAATVHHSRAKHAPASRANVEGTRQVTRLAAQRGVRCVFMSTSGTVGCSASPHDAPTEDAPYCEAQVGRWPYYASKIAAEKAARAEMQAAGELVVVRPPVILGPADHRFRSTSNIIRLLRGRLPFVLSGEMHFVDVRDVAQALLRAMVQPRVPAVVHLPGHRSSLRNFFGQVADIAGVRAPKRVLPLRLARLLARADGGLTRLLGARAPHLFVDEVVVEMGCAYWGLGSAGAAEAVGFTPRPAHDTLQDTVAWLRGARSDCGRNAMTQAV